MKTIVTSVLLLMVTHALIAQDLIVTNEGDSINCKITRVKADNIYFTFKYNNEIRHTLLPKSGVKEHRFDFYKTSEVTNADVKKHEDYPRFRIALGGGYSYQTAKVAESVPGDFKDYVRKLKSGYHFGGDVTYFLSEPLGIGFKYLMFKSSNSADNIYVEDNTGNITYGKMSDDMTITFLGPSFSTRIFNHSKSNAFLMNLSLGYLGYVNNKTVIDRYQMTGGTVGLALDLGYDIGLSKNLSLGFQISSVTGMLSKYKWNDGAAIRTIQLEKGEYESLNRLDFSVGLRYIR